MAFKDLHPDVAAKLNRDKPLVDYRVKGLTPMQKIDLREAVKEGKRRAKLQGKDFTIKYRGDLIWFQPVDILGMPCGWVSKEKIIKGDYLI